MNRLKEQIANEMEAGRLQLTDFGAPRSPTEGTCAGRGLRKACAEDVQVPAVHQRVRGRCPDVKPPIARSGATSTSSGSGPREVAVFVAPIG
jgi:hypothetical protein